MLHKVSSVISFIMDKVVASAKAYLGHLSRTIQAVQNLLTQQMSDKLDGDLELALVQLEKKWDAYELAAKKIVDAIDPNSVDAQDQLDAAIKAIDEQRDRLMAFKVPAERLRRSWNQAKQDQQAKALAQATPPPQINLPPPNVTVQMQPATGAQPTVRAMKIKPAELKPFTGEDALAWTPFWDVYNSGVHTQTHLSDAEKFALLRQYLEGNALLTIEGLQITATNYPVAVKLLQDRFADKEVIIAAHLSKLDSIAAARDGNNILAVRTFQLTVEMHINALSALGVDKTGYGALLTTRLLQKIPEQLQKKWYEDPSRKATEIDPFLKFLKENVEALERFSRLKQLMEGNQPPKPAAPPRPVISTTSALPTSSHQVPGTKWPCPFGCAAGHRPSKCPLSIPDRRKALFDKKACFNCFKKGHVTKDCTSTEMGPCPRCNGKHHSATCAKQRNARPSGSAPQPAQSVSADPSAAVSSLASATPIISASATVLPTLSGATPIISSATAITTRSNAHPIVSSPSTDSIVLAARSNSNALLATATIIINGPAGPLKIRCLLDHAAHNSYITRRAAEAAKLVTCGRERMVVSGFAGQQTAGTFDRVDCSISDRNGINNILIQPLVADKVCDFIDQPAEQHWKDRLDHNQLGLADDEDPNLSGRVDLLIGADNYWKVVDPEGSVLIENGPMAIASLFGWAFSGQRKEPGFRTQATAMTSSTRNDDNAAAFHQLQQMLDVDRLESPAQNFSVQDPVLERFERTVQYEKQRYTVELPFKEPRMKLASNEIPVRKQLDQLIKRLKASGQLERYDDGIKELIQRGFVEEVPPDVLDKKEVHYLAHHPVYREDKISTKLRQVFNGSGGKTPLNDQLETGPNLNPQLTSSLQHMRLFRVGLTADIEKAFHQMNVAEKDRDFLRFFWIDLVSGVIKRYRWRTVPFGIRSSPFLLAATLRHHLKKKEIDLFQLVKDIADRFYVDDFIAGADTVEKALQIANTLVRVLLEAGFPLRRLVTNSPELQKILADLGYSTNETFTVSDLMVAKVLGLVWEKRSDSFSFQTSSAEEEDKPDRITSMRFLLAAFSKVFDPLGLVSPFIIYVRILFQELWKRKVTWDDPLPADIADKFRQWQQQLPLLSSVAVPRHFFRTVGPDRKVQLHIFCDASEKAYGAVAHLRAVDDNNNMDITLVGSKAKVAPLTIETICRMELEAAKEGVKLADSIVTALGEENIHSVHYWTDSMVTLAWIQDEPHHLKTFVAHRVQSILLGSKRGDWSHIAGAENPADICSRGCLAEELLKSISWWQATDWLGKPEQFWPGKKQTLVQPDVPEYWKETRAGICLLALNDDPPAQLIQLERFSNFNRAVRALAWVHRFIYNCRQQTEESRRAGELTLDEVHHGKMALVRAAQEDSFPVETLALQSGHHLLRESKLLCLRPYYDQNDKVIRLRRRTELSAEGGEDPVVLPQKHQITNLIIRDTHRRLHHAGTSHTLVEVRRFAWIMRGRRAVHELLVKCVTCRRQQGPSLQQPIAPLPSNRCSSSLAFDTVGIDFAGPLFIRDESIEEGASKVYICLFTCAATRAVHLELVRSLSTHHFLLALRRFISTRGLCSFIYSDNAKTFEAADRELQELWANLKKPDVKAFFTSSGIEWQFICPLAPWWGAFYERLVRSVKLPLRKILGNALLDYDELETVLKEVEAMVNSRPLTYVYNHLDEPDPLTPSHFLMGKRLNVLPPISISNRQPDIPDEEPSELTRRARYREKLLNRCWKVFTGEYFQQLAHKAAKPHPERQIRPGLVVLVHQEIIPRHKWKLAVVTEVYPGRDGVVRKVQLRTESGTIERPVQRLYSLEVQHEADGFILPEAALLPVDDDGNESGDAEENESREVVDADTATASRGEDIATRCGRRIVRPSRFLN